MMAGITSYFAFQCLDNLFGSDTWIQLHTGDPGPRGEDNIALNDVRKQGDFEFVDCFTWQNTNSLVWLITGHHETYTHASIWNDPTDGRALWSAPLSKIVAVNADDSFTLSPSSVLVSFT